MVSFTHAHPLVALQLLLFLKRKNVLASGHPFQFVEQTQRCLQTHTLSFIPFSLLLLWPALRLNLLLSLHARLSGCFKCWLEMKGRRRWSRGIKARVKNEKKQLLHAIQRMSGPSEKQHLKAEREREERHGGGTREQGRHFTEQGGDV